MFSKVKVFVPLGKNEEKWYDRYKGLCVISQDESENIKEYCAKTSDLSKVEAAATATTHSSRAGILELGPLKDNPNGVSVAAKDRLVY